MTAVFKNIPDFFRPGGPLSKALAGYEHRPQQVEMSEAVASAIADGEHLTAEAGTGVGKSLAYLLPAFIHALKTNQPVIISTYTINLQEQLLEKDIPILEDALGVRIRAAAAMGRRNYLCLRRLTLLRNWEPSLFEKESSADELARIQEWSFATEDGSLSDLEFEPSPALWEKICSNRFTCMGRSCSFNEACFFRKARQKLLQVQIIVANHYLYFTDLALPPDAQQILPEHSCAVFDEAHTLEDVASECLGLTVSQRSLTYLLQNLFGTQRRPGLLQRYLDGKFTGEAAALFGGMENFFEAVKAWTEQEAPENLRIRQPLPVSGDFPDRLMAFTFNLMSSDKEADNKDTAAEVSGRAMEIMEYAETAETIRKLKLEGYAYWVDKDRKDISLKCAPIRMSGLLSQVLFPEIPSIILTGATLTVGNSFSFLRERLGLERAREIHLGSPFDYEKQAVIHIEKEIPPPHSGEYLQHIGRALRHYLKESHGRALVLFTSYENMRRVSEELSQFLEEQGWQVLIQGSGRPRATLLEIFKHDTNSVLFGTSSFWQGIDVPGEALSSVIITHLPFAVPTLPMQQARCEDLEERGLDAFRNYSLPQAVIRLKQGVGRLIRSKTDTGSIVLLDSRVVTRWYGRTFLESLPPCEIQVSG